jgi:tRNA-dihydrouridine synthase B
MASMALGFYERKLAEKRAVLAPMAGYTDAPFRKLCREFGSSWAVTEMVSAKGLVQGDLRGIEIGEPYAGEPDVVIQVFGGEAEIVAEGGQILFEKYKPDALDLNMGCPVKKITGKSCGSKLMQDPGRAAEIIRQLVQAVPIPVSAKMRLGYDRVNVLEVALALQEAGVSLIAIHGRTAEQKYTGEAKWEAIKDVADQLETPVIGSGDVTTKEQFERYQSWGLGVMIARGAMGRPWIFAELQGQDKPSPKEISNIAYHHAERHCQWYAPQSELHAMRALRSQLIHYFSFLPDARAEVSQLESLAALRQFIDKHFADTTIEPSNPTRVLTDIW